MVSLVALLTPPNDPIDGEGRIKAFFRLESVSILVLSPRILPLFLLLDGSIAKTATFSSFFSIKYLPKLSINVLLPTPGTPVIPIRLDFPE